MNIDISFILMLISLIVGLIMGIVLARPRSLH